MMPGAKFTDNELKKLYFGLAAHYKDCMDRSPAMAQQDIYNELHYGVHYAVNTPLGSLYGLDPFEKLKAFTVLNTFLKACPVPRELPPPVYQVNTMPVNLQPVRVTVINNYYQRDNSFFYDWLLLNSLSNSFNSRPNHVPYGSSSTSHQHASEDGKKKEGDILALLLLLALAAAALAATFIAVYYLLKETLNSVERFYYNEGWMQAAISLLSMPVSAAASAILALTFAAAPLAALAIAAGVANPFGVVLTGVVCLTIIGSAAGCFITNQIQDYFIKQLNPNAIDATDPKRFALTASEEENLRDKGMDPIKVKCALVALRAKIGEAVPSYLNRFGAKGAEAQEALNLIRQLRRGERSTVPVGDMSFDCSADVYYPQPMFQPQYQPPPYGYAPLQQQPPQQQYPQQSHSQPYSNGFYQPSQEGYPSLQQLQQQHGLVQPSAPLQEHNSFQY